MLPCNQPKWEAWNTTGQTSPCWSYICFSTFILEIILSYYSYSHAFSISPILLKASLMYSTPWLYWWAADTSVPKHSSQWCLLKVQHRVLASLSCRSLLRHKELAGCSHAVITTARYIMRVRALGKLLWTSSKRQNRSFAAEVLGINLHLLRQQKHFFSLNNLNTIVNLMSVLLTCPSCGVWCHT